MFWDLLVAVFLAASPTIAGVIKEGNHNCSAKELSCDDGTCYSMERLCDGVQDCWDGSDEAACYFGSSLLTTGDMLNRSRRKASCGKDQFQCTNGECIISSGICNGIIDCLDKSDESNETCSHNFNSSLTREDDVNRGKRQSGCGKNKWQCANGECISFDGKCDGEVDCSDGSDETHPLCRNVPCQDNLFRCTYGACVDGTAPCNNKKECADNSDELLPRCSNITRTDRNRFTCDSGQQISVAELCDGVPDCDDGSDEIINACAGKTCHSYLFQCAYGACVDQGSDCNGKQECADNSDESDELCNRISTIVKPTGFTTKPSPGFGSCVLPPYPKNGIYEVQGDPLGSPGKRYPAVRINVTCEQGYAVEDKSSVVCVDGRGFENIPQCTRYCVLKRHHSVEYTCFTRFGNSMTTRPCNDREFPGTTVQPKCREPNYRGTVSNMHCMEFGDWDSNAKCSPECGRITPDGQEYVIGGKRAKHGELPWHAGVYTKATAPYSQICGGSLVNTRAVISAAHCFWKDVIGLLPASRFAVALGKIYRPWNDPHDEEAQRSNITDIHIPPEFRGATINFQQDIAIVILEATIVYQTFIRPICVDFDVNFEAQQLKTGELGKISGWGLTASNGSASQVLLTVQLPYVTFDQCFKESPEDFREYITAGKFCAGYLNGTALCQGDSGGGLAFPATEQGIQRYYLRGIVSSAPRNKMSCDANVRTTFTKISSHEKFIKDYVSFN